MAFEHHKIGDERPDTENLKIEETLNGEFDFHQLRTMKAEPKKPREGMVIKVDGVHWNPGKGQGYYVRENGIWKKLATTDAVGLVDTGRVDRFGFYVDGDGTVKAFVGSGGEAATEIASGSPARVNNPVFIFVQRESGVLKMWFNNVEEAGSAASTQVLTATSPTFYLGRNSGAIEPFVGILDDCGVGSGALTAAERTNLYETGGAAICSIGISNSTYDSKTYDMSAQDSDMRAGAFSSDGTKMYAYGRTNHDVYQYALSTPWDVSTASYTKAFTTPVANADAMRFSTDGTELYLAVSNAIHQYTLSTAWDVGTASFTRAQGSFDATMTGLDFSADGTKLIVTYNSTFQWAKTWDLSTAWDISSVTADTSLRISDDGVTDPRSVRWSADGKYFFVCHTGGTVKEYTCTTDFDINTASLTDTFTNTGQTGSGMDNWLDAGLGRLYVFDNAQKVYQYSTDGTCPDLSSYGLVSYWKLDETSGTTLTDDQGSNDLTIGGTYTLNQTAIGNTAAAIDFEDAVATVSADNLIAFSGDFFFFGWLKITSVGNIQRVMTSLGGVAGTAESDNSVFTKLTSEPATSDGKVAYADGTSWDPGSGEGVYVYYNSTWNKMG